MGGLDYYPSKFRHSEENDERFFRQQEWLREHKKWEKQG